MTATQKLFSPVQVGPLALSHRVVMAPSTRSRSQQPGDVPGDLMVEYYGQRASEGGFIISEATTISVTGRGWFGARYAGRTDSWQRIRKGGYSGKFERQRAGAANCRRDHAAFRATLPTADRDDYGLGESGRKN